MQLTRTIATLERLVGFDTVSSRSNVELIDWVANRLADSEIASEIYSTAGEFDLLAKFYVDQATDIGHFVNEKVQIIPGIQDTRTIITFKAF